MLLPISESTATDFCLELEKLIPEPRIQILGALNCSIVLSCRLDFRSKFCRYFVSQTLHAWYMFLWTL